MLRLVVISNPAGLNELVTHTVMTGSAARSA